MHIDLKDLIQDVQAAQAKMSRKNDHRAVLHRCELALIALTTERLEHLKAQEPPSATAAA